MTLQRTPKAHRQVFRLAASSALIALFVLPTVSSLPSVWAVTATSMANATSMATVPTVAGPATVTLTKLSPAVALPKASVTISGSVHNAAQVSIASPVVRAFIGNQPLITRDAVSQWADTREQQQLGSEGARIALGPRLSSGHSVSFTITIPAAAVPHRESFAVLPLLVDVVGTVPSGTTSSGTTSSGTTSAGAQDLGSLHTFLPVLSSVKRYEPFSIAWLVPLTLDPDPALFGTNSAARTAAWTKAIGPGSRLDGVIAGTDSSKVTWAIDPAVLGPPKAPASAKTTPAPSPTPSDTTAPGQGGGATSPDPVTQATTALADRLRTAAPRHTLWSLPYADPDLAALLPLPDGVSMLAASMAHTPTLDATVGPARTDIAWPVAGIPTTHRQNQLKAAFSSRGLSAVVTSSSNLANDSGLTQDASRRSSAGLPLLAYDVPLSRTFAQTSSAAAGTITIQRFLADTLALLGERPGTSDRSVLVVAPRTFAGDPTVLRSFFAAIAKAPWLVPTTTDQLLTAANLATPEPPGFTPATPTPPATPTATPALPAPADPLLPGTSPLSADRLAKIPAMTSAVTGIASIRDDPEPFRTRWTDAENQTVSARWRDHGLELAAIDRAAQAAVKAISQGVSVSPSSVNFFADKGVLQITVVNNLDIAVHGVHLTLTPGQPRLRIEQQPGPLRIGAKSRTNVPLRVTAVAAGLVPIKAVLTTPNGTPLGQNAHVDVRVQPTSTWIYWVLGAVAGLILVLGTFRSLRRGSTRAGRPAAEVIPLDV